MSEDNKQSQSQHPLQNRWNWSYKPTIVYKQQTAEDWLSDYRVVCGKPFETVEEFWAIFTNMHTLNDLDYGNIYAVFRDGILPVWEHKANENGYSIVIYLNKINTTDYIEKMYLASLLTLIGNNGSYSSVLNGCTFERKGGGNKIVFWMAETPKTPQERFETVKQVLISLGVQQKDTKFTDPNARIDWRDQSFSGFKIAVACKSHKARVMEQPGLYSPSTASSTSASSQSRGATTSSSSGVATRGVKSQRGRQSGNSNTHHRTGAGDRGSAGSQSQQPSNSNTSRNRYTRQ